MAEDEWALIPDQHQRTIVHIDVDCFYAQVEMVRDPSLRDKPLGIKQKNLMVTSNYVARSMGVKKSMWIKDALKILPDLVLVDGSDLTHYRQFSAEISGVAQTFTPNVERLGLDENFLDISDIVSDYMNPQFKSIEGHVFGDKEGNKDFGDPCGCGCLQRLTAGSHVARKLRQHIFDATGITCCAGVAHNKLLAKLVSGYYKPNQQTVLFPWQVYEVMMSLTQARSIPGIGSTTCKTLEDLGISTVQELQSASLNTLSSRFDKETSIRLKDLSYGIDTTPVRKSGRPQSIGLEDAFKKVNSIAEVRIKYHTLLGRLLKLLAEDGRVPGALKVSVRKFHKEVKFGHRETKQVPISKHLFSAGVKSLPERSKEELMKMTMNLFHKMVDTTKEYHLTLVGVGFTKFIERAPEGMSISDFFTKSLGPPKTNRKIHVKHSEKTSQYSPGKSDIVTESTGQEIDVQVQEENLPEDLNEEEDFQKPLEDKCKDSNSTKEKLICGTEISRGNDRSLSDLGNMKSDSDELLNIPSEIDKDVFMSLPRELQSEVLKSYQHNLLEHESEDKKSNKVKVIQQNKNSKGNSCKKRSLDTFFKKDIVHESDSKKIKMDQNIQKPCELSNSKIPCIESYPSCSNQNSIDKQSLEEPITHKVDKKIEGSNEDFLEAIDPEVFSSLPKELQDEILAEQRMKKPSVCPHKSNKVTGTKLTKKLPSILTYFKKS